MRKIKSEVVDDPVLISGLIKQLLFLPGMISLEGKKNRHSFELLEVVESSTRSIADKRYLRLRGVQTFQIKVGKSVWLEFGFGRFMAKGEAIVESVSRENVNITIPSSLEIINLRNSSRQNLAKDSDCFPVLVETDGSHVEGLLKVDDASLKGLGGVLTLPSSVPLRCGSRIIGRKAGGKGDLSINAIVLRATLLESTQDGTVFIRVGLSQQKSIEVFDSALEKRRFSRLETEEIIFLIPLLKIQQKIEFSVANASVAGFSGLPRAKNDHLNFPIGSQFQIENTSLVVELIGADECSLRFCMVGGTEGDRLSWLKRLAIYLHRDVSLDARDARDILDIFCEAGALSSAFLKSHKPYSAQILKDLEVESNARFWVHRWISKDGDGKIRGHVSAIKAADNLWILGDLVGSRIASSKLPQKFVPDFFLSFMELSMSLSPCPKHMIMWVEGHRYWKLVEEYAFGKGKGFLYASSRLAYSRISVADDVSSDPNVRIQKVEACDNGRIKVIRKKLRKNKLLAFASALDFDADRFASPHLRDAFQEIEQRFYRHYYTIKTDSSEWLVVLTGLPVGTSLNRIPESAWVFPLTDAAVNEKEWKTVVNCIRSEALRIGIKLPCIRRFLLSNNSEKLKDELAVMQCLLTHPKVWEFYRGST